MRSFLEQARLNNTETDEILVLVIDQEQVTIPAKENVSILQYF